MSMYRDLAVSTSYTRLDGILIDFDAINYVQHLMPWNIDSLDRSACFHRGQLETMAPDVCAHWRKIRHDTD